MYLIDSDVLIDAKNHHYGFDLVPGFWDWMGRAHLDGQVFTVQQVVDEILAGGDELSTWMDAQPDTFKLKPRAGQWRQSDRHSTARGRSQEEPVIGAVPGQGEKSSSGVPVGDVVDTGVVDGAQARAAWSSQPHSTSPVGSITDTTETSPQGGSSSWASRHGSWS